MNNDNLVAHIHYGHVHLLGSVSRINDSVVPHSHTRSILTVELYYGDIDTLISFDYDPSFEGYDVRVVTEDTEFYTTLYIGDMLIDGHYDKDTLDCEVRGMLIYIENILKGRKYEQ